MVARAARGGGVGRTGIDFPAVREHRFVREPFPFIVSDDRNVANVLGRVASVGNQNSQRGLDDRGGAALANIWIDIFPPGRLCRLRQ